MDKSSDDPSGIVSVAGYIGTEEQWLEIEDKWDNEWSRWRTIPKLDSLKYFHMSKLADFIGIDLARDCINVFKRLIEESQLQAIGAAVHEPHWNLPNWGHDLTPRLRSPYQQALDMALRAAVKVAQTRSPTHTISVICCEDDSRARIYETFGDNQARSPSFEILTIGRASSFIGLQCADLGAGMLRQSWRGIFLDEDNVDVFGHLPSGAGTSPATTFWSLRQAWLLKRALDLAGAPERPS